MYFVFAGSVLGAVSSYATHDEVVQGKFPEHLAMDSVCHQETSEKLYMVPATSTILREGKKWLQGKNNHIMSDTTH